MKRWLNRLKALRHERAAEVPLALEFLQRHYSPSTLEVGNVLANYTAKYPRRVVDKYEKAQGVENVDVLALSGEYDTTVSVSTIEHVGFDTPEPFAPGRAIDAIKLLSGLSRNLLVTTPVGWNTVLDDWLRQQPETTSLKRTSYFTWKACPVVHTERIRYGFPYHNANGIFVYQFTNTTR